MLRLLQILLIGHAHKWEIVSKGTYADYDGEPGKSALLSRGTQYTMRCQHCGEMKVFKE